MIELYQNEYVAEFLIYTHLGKRRKEKQTPISQLFTFAVGLIAAEFF